MIYTDTLQTIIMVVGSFILMGFGNMVFSFYSYTPMLFLKICCNVKTNPVCDTVLFASKNDSNLHTRPQLSVRWEAMTDSMTCTSRPSLLSRLTSVRAATSLGQTPSIFLGTRLPETCRGLALCLDSPFRPPGTGAPIRSVKQMGRTVWRDHDFTCADSVAAMRERRATIHILTHSYTHLWAFISPIFARLTQAV